MRERLKSNSLLLFILALQLLTGPVLATDSETDSKKPDLSNLKKSLLFPGWGQLSEGKTVKGIAFMAIELFCIGSAVYHNSRGNRYYRDYKSADTIDSTIYLRERTEHHDRSRNLSILAGAGIWILNLIDMTIGHRKKRGKKRISFSLDQYHEKSFQMVLRIYL